jgi:hypothetical protein
MKSHHAQTQETVAVEIMGVYADLVTAAGFKPVVAAEKSPGGFDSLPLPYFHRSSLVVVGPQLWPVSFCCGRSPSVVAGLRPSHCS